MADGSVHFVAQNINHPLYRSLCTKGEGETAAAAVTAMSALERLSSAHDQLDLRRASVSMLVLAAAAAGCFGANAASVSGTVTLDGQPLTTGNVSFYPDGGSGAPAYGQIDSSGRYSLSTGTDAGLARQVRRRRRGDQGPAASPTMRQAPKSRPFRSRRPNTARMTTSDLRVEVKPGKTTFRSPCNRPANRAGDSAHCANRRHRTSRLYCGASSPGSSVRRKELPKIPDFIQPADLRVAT